MFILDIDIRVPVQEFKNKFITFTSRYLGNVTNVNYTIDVAEAKTRNGNKMYRTELVSPNGKSTATIVCNCNPTDGYMEFTNIKLRNLQDRFYMYYTDKNDLYTYNDAFGVFVDFLKELAVEKEGTLVVLYEIESTYDSGKTYKSTIINHGNNTENNATLSLIDNQGNIYPSRNSKSKIVMEDDNIMINKPINEWIKEHPDIQTNIMQIPNMIEKLNYIGKTLIAMRINDEIEYDEFYDILTQASLLGMNDKLCTTITKIIT